MSENDPIRTASPDPTEETPSLEAPGTAQAPQSTQPEAPSSKRHDAPSSPAADAPVRSVSPEDPAEEPPPFLGSWRNVYALVLGELVVTAILFYALTRWAS